MKYNFKLICKNIWYKYITQSTRACYTKYNKSFYTHILFSGALTTFNNVKCPTLFDIRTVGRWCAMSGPLSLTMSNRSWDDVRVKRFPGLIEIKFRTSAITTLTVYTRNRPTIVFFPTLRIIGLKVGFFHGFGG